MLDKARDTENRTHEKMFGKEAQASKNQIEIDQ